MDPYRGGRLFAFRRANFPFLSAPPSLCHSSPASASAHAKAHVDGDASSGAGPRAKQPNLMLSKVFYFFFKVLMQTYKHKSSKIIKTPSLFLFFKVVVFFAFCFSTSSVVMSVKKGVLFVIRGYEKVVFFLGLKRVFSRV